MGEFVMVFSQKQLQKIIFETVDEINKLDLKILILRNDQGLYNSRSDIESDLLFWAEY